MRFTPFPAVDVFPDFGGLGGRTDIEAAIGALLTFVLLAAVLTLIVCGIVWAIAAGTGAYQAAARAKTGLFVALGVAILAGMAVTWANFLVDVGERI